jgi:hypothetical protein
VLGLVVLGLWISPTYQCVRVPLRLTLVFRAAQDERLKSRKPHAWRSTAQAKAEHHHPRSRPHFPARIRARDRPLRPCDSPPYPTSEVSSSSLSARPAPSLWVPFFFAVAAVAGGEGGHIAMVRWFFSIPFSIRLRECSVREPLRL